MCNFCACIYFFNKSKDSFRITNEENGYISGDIEETKEIDTGLANSELRGDNNDIIESKDLDEIIIVHISGAIANEGIVELNKKNNRVADAIEKAGGLRENASIKNINLAYKLEDGMKVHIPSSDEEEKEINNTQEHLVTENMDNYIEIKSPNENGYNTYAKEEEMKVNINTATQTELETLPGIGPSIALKIINYRKENGSFKCIDDIKEVTGIGDAKFENIKNFIVI